MQVFVIFIMMFIIKFVKWIKLFDYEKIKRWEFVGTLYFMNANLTSNRVNENEIELGVPKRCLFKINFEQVY